MKRSLLTATIHYHRHELISPRYPLMLSVLHNPITTPQAPFELLLAGRISQSSLASDLGDLG
jgi:hypothetical protein